MSFLPSFAVTLPVGLSPVAATATVSFARVFFTTTLPRALVTFIVGRALITWTIAVSCESAKPVAPLNATVTVRFPAVVNGPTVSFALPPDSATGAAVTPATVARTVPSGSPPAAVTPTVRLALPDPARIFAGDTVTDTSVSDTCGPDRPSPTSTGLRSDEANGETASTRFVTFALCLL